jgi:hypothetical protein
MTALMTGAGRGTITVAGSNVFYIEFQLEKNSISIFGLKMRTTQPAPILRSTDLILSAAHVYTGGSKLEFRHLSLQVACELVSPTVMCKGVQGDLSALLASFQNGWCVTTVYVASISVRVKLLYFCSFFQ